MPQASFDATPQFASEGFEIEASGTGTFTGLAFSIPAHTEGKAKVQVQVEAMGSENLQELNKSIMTLLNVSQQKTVEEHKAVSAHADLSLWDVLGFGGSGGASASYERSKSSMESLGLSEEQISMIIKDFFKAASKMSHVELRLEIDNRANDYAVHGGLELYTMSGHVRTGEESHQYRLLATEGTAGVPGPQAPTNSDAGPLKWLGRCE